MMEVGRVCTKTAGREAGSHCIVVDVMDDSFVLIDGPGIKRRRCNIKHLELLPEKLTIKKGAAEKEAIDALIKAGIVTETTPKPKKEKKEKKEEKKEKPAEKPKRAGVLSRLGRKEKK